MNQIKFRYLFAAMITLISFSGSVCFLGALTPVSVMAMDIESHGSSDDDGEEERDDDDELRRVANNCCEDFCSGVMEKTIDFCDSDLPRGLSRSERLFFCGLKTVTRLGWCVLVLYGAAHASLLIDYCLNQIDP